MSSGPLAFQTNAARGRSVACASEKGVPKSFERLATAIGSQPLHQEKPFSTRPGHSMPRIRIQTAVRRRSVFNSLVLGLAEHFQCDPAALTANQLRDYFLFLRQHKQLRAISSPTCCSSLPRSAECYLER